MAKTTFLKGRHLLVMFVWLIFKTYKVRLMKYWDDKGMIDAIAFDRAWKTSRKEYREKYQSLINPPSKQ